MTREMEQQHPERVIQQQGSAPEEPAILRWHFRALLFQPAIVGPSVVVATSLQARMLFFVLAALLAWNTVFPRWNPFERFYDWAVGRRRGLPRLEPAPVPRCFMQGMATAFMLVVGLALSLGWRTTAYVFEGFLIAAFAALRDGKFCAGAYIRRVLRGRVDFANATCPWSRS
jgi:hypothetical protein